LPDSIARARQRAISGTTIDSIAIGHSDNGGPAGSDGSCQSQWLRQRNRFDVRDVSRFQLLERPRAPRAERQQEEAQSNVPDLQVTLCKNDFQTTDVAIIRNAVEVRAAARVDPRPGACPRQAGHLVKESCCPRAGRVGPWRTWLDETTTLPRTSCANCAVLTSALTAN
jgi:hypothetical protein